MAIFTVIDRAPVPVSPRRASPLLLRLVFFVAAPALFLCAVEGALRVAGFGKPAEFFIPDGKAGYYRTNPNFTAPFIPTSFGIEPLSLRVRMHKEPNTVRVLVLGESAAQGMPDPDFGFAAQLRAQLKARFPGKGFEVLNLGIAAIDSHVVYQIVRQVGAFEPDALVVYMGDNEAVGPYGPGCAYLSANPPLWVIRASVWVRTTRTGQLLARLLGRLAISPLKAQDWKGMETLSEDYVRGDDPRLEATYRNFSANLKDIADIAGHAGIKVVLSTVVANLKDNAPFVSLHRDGLSPEEARAWKAAFGAGTIAWELGDTQSAVFGYDEAQRIDPEFAETHFRLGRLAEARGDAALAHKCYLDALHWDALRLRPDARVNEIIRRIAQGAGGSVVLVDAARAMGSDPDSPVLPGREILFDHVHFNWEGNCQMARLLADGCAQALFGPDASPRAGLDSDGCAAALGYTPDAQLRMLETVVQLTLRPPFTSQFTFSGDQARLAKEIERANALLRMPDAGSAGLDAVERALQLDPDNASLAAHLGVMESDAGDMDRALFLLERAAALEPPSAELSRRTAQVLARLKRYGEAEDLLLGSLELDQDHAATVDALVDLWAASGRLDKGKRFFARELAKAPDDGYLRMEYANLLFRAGEPDGAEREARRIWDGDRGSRPAAAALELLVRIFDGQRRTAAADALTLEAAAYQAGDYDNNRRLVRIYTLKDNPGKVAESLQAVAASGPFDAAEHLDLARRLADLNRGPEMLSELAQAREVARIEGSGPQLARIDELIGVFRQRFGSGGAR